MLQNNFLKIADRAARQAGKIILDGLYRLGHIHKQQKENRSPVTEIDIRAEKAIIEQIQTSFPYHGILAEESDPIDGKDYTWIIDPLDGTCNFIHDFPHFAVSIAIRNEKINCIEYALVYDPLRQETFTAMQGRGAYLHTTTQRFTRRIRVSERNSIEASLLGISLPSRGNNVPIPPLNKEALRNMMAQASGVRRTGSAVLDLAYVAAGRLDAALALDLESWDIAAGILLIQEAGGITRDLKGGKDYFNTGHIIGANPKLCPLLLNTIHLEP